MGFSKGEGVRKHERERERDEDTRHRMSNIFIWRRIRSDSVVMACVKEDKEGDERASDSGKLPGIHETIQGQRQGPAKSSDSSHFPSLFPNDFAPEALLDPSDCGQRRLQIVPPDSPLRYPAYPVDEPDIVMDSSNLFTTHILPSLFPSLHQQHHHDTLASSPDSDDDGSEFGITSTSNLSYIAQKSLLKTAVPLKSAFQLWLTTSCMILLDRIHYAMGHFSGIGERLFWISEAAGDDAGRFPGKASPALTHPPMLLPASNSI
ncbi:hypothetical protein C8J56DRAFT_1036399 [Mycena floridula]|nr:hypothetical protein C8J56DRAFT_1036399 [Mycena floridula]